MAENFFPQSVIAYTTDISRAVYPEELDVISKFITHTEIEKTIEKLPTQKIPGPEGITNRLLKHYKLTLSKDLAENFNACQSLSYHPHRFKESTTILLRKPQKPWYDTTKAYRPIALLKTTGKLLEKLVASGQPNLQSCRRIQATSGWIDGSSSHEIHNLSRWAYNGTDQYHMGKR